MSASVFRINDNKNDAFEVWHFSFVPLYGCGNLFFADLVTSFAMAASILTCGECEPHCFEYGEKATHCEGNAFHQTTS